MGKGEKIIKGSFWVIAAIHVAVFTAIGFATSSWRLLLIFITGFAATMAVWAGIKVYLAKKQKNEKNTGLHRQ